MNRAMIFLSLLALLVPGTKIMGEGKSPLAFVKTDDPRDTMRTFMAAMNDYKRGVDTENERLLARLDDAVRTLNLSGVNQITRVQTGKDAAIYLKEVIDRVIVINYDYIPTAEDARLKTMGYRWRLKSTEITIRRVESGDRKGEYLFTGDTVARARGWYERVKHLPYQARLSPPERGAGYRKPLIEESIPKWMNDVYLGLAVWQWLGIVVAVFLGLFIKVILHYFTGLLARLVQKSESKWDDQVIDALKKPIGYLGAVGFWFLTVHILRFEGTVLNAFTIFLKVFFSLVLIWMIYRLAGVLTLYLQDLAARTESTLDDQLVPLLNRTLKILIVIAGVLIAIQNLGVNVMSVLAGLGIGGLAIAMAAKDTVANFFGSLMILFDRPFQVGDWIIVGAAEGTVEEIGFRSTRIRTFYNSVISVPNSEVANVKIDNMGMREYRRVYSKIGVTYDTPPEKLEAFMEGIKNIIKANPYTRKDYFHVVFSDYGDSSLNIMLYFFLRVPTWNDELVERQNVYLEIKRLAVELGIEFAFPTRTLHVENFPEKQPLRPPVEVSEEQLKKTARAFGGEGEKSRPGGLGFFTPPHRE